MFPYLRRPTCPLACLGVFFCLPERVFLFVGFFWAHQNLFSSVRLNFLFFAARLILFLFFFSSEFLFFAVRLFFLLLFVLFIISLILAPSTNPFVSSSAARSFYLMGWSPTFWTVGNEILTGHLDKQAGGSATGTVSEPIATVFQISTFVFIKELRLFGPCGCRHPEFGHQHGDPRSCGFLFLFFCFARIKSKANNTPMCVKDVNGPFKTKNRPSSCRLQCRTSQPLKFLRCGKYPDAIYCVWSINFQTECHELNQVQRKAHITVLGTQRTVDLTSTVQVNLVVS